MKRKIITLLLAMAATSVFSATAMAADETINGFYDIGTAANVEIVPYAGTSVVTVSEKNIDDDTAKENVYVGSDRIVVTFTGATAGEEYGVILVDGSGLPTEDSVVYYINQETANSSSVSFNVYPKLPAETTDMTLYISSSEDNSTLVSVSMNYAVNATEVATYTPGDANGDNKVDASDVTAIRQHIVGGYGVTINESAADTNKNGSVEAGDVTVLRQFIVGGYGVVL